MSIGYGPEDKRGSKTRNQRYRLILLGEDGDNGGTAAPDPTFSNVMAQSSFEGISGNSVGNADDANTVPWTSSTTGSKYLTAAAIFGSTGIELDENSAWVGIDGTSASPGTEINTQDWAFECFWTPRDLSTDRIIFVITGTSSTFGLRFWYSQATGDIKMDVSETGAVWVNKGAWAINPVADTTYELAVGADSNGIRLIVDGEQEGADQTYGTPDVFDAAVQHLFLGYSNGAPLLHGWAEFDAVRMTIGECHIVGSYNPRTEYFPTS